MVSSVLPLRMMSGMGRRRVRRTRSRRVGGRKMKMMIQGSGRRRLRGKGFFDTLKNIGSKAFNLARSVPIVSTGLNLAGQKKYADVAKSLGFGRKRRRARRRVGGRRRIGARRRIRGYGLFDTLKNIGSKAFNLARSVPIVSTGLNLAGQKKYADVAKSLGFGRKRRRVRRRVGGARPKKRTFSVYGGRRMSVYGGRKRVTRRGGLFGSLMGAIPLAMRALGGRRKRAGARRRRIGGRRRTYPSGLLTLRRMMRR
jgi:hypothetical protein